MTEKQKNWAKSHKNEFANKIINESGAIPDGNPTAIFMAGLPGAGKTEFSKALVYILDGKVIRLDMDEIASQIEGYDPRKADLFRGAATEILNRTFDLVLKKRIDFIMDGTFGSKNAEQNVQRTIDRGYKAKIIYVYQDPKLAWNFTKEREKTEHRAIDEEGFIETYFNTIKNLKTILNKFNSDKITVDIIVKNEYNKINKWIEKTNIEEIDKMINNNYNKETLRSYIND